MKYEIVNLEKKIVVGLSDKTKNSDSNMSNVISGLWNNLYSKGVYESILNKKNFKSLGIYSDYESDMNGEYGVTVGVEVSKAEQVKENMIIKIIPAGKYAKFIVHGHMKKAVMEFWEELWKMNLSRSYVCDFEEYQNAEIENAEIHIYISIN